MLSGTDLEALKAIAERGGVTTIKVVNSKVGFNSDYIRIICEDLGRHDYINVYRSGKCEMTPKGWQELEQRGWRKEEAKTEPAPSIKCPRCGELNKQDRVFCSFCWQYLGEIKVTEPAGDIKETEPATSASSAGSTYIQELFKKYERAEISEQRHKQKKAEKVAKKARG